MIHVVQATTSVLQIGQQAKPDFTSSVLEKLIQEAYAATIQQVSGLKEIKQIDPKLVGSFGILVRQLDRVLATRNVVLAELGRDQVSYQP